MAIVGQNSLLNQYVPTFYIKDLLDGQTLRYDSRRKAFVNAEGGGGTGADRLGELLDVSSSVDNPLSLQNGQALVFNSFTSLWENKFTDYNTLLNKPVIPTNSSFSFIGLSDTATPSLPNGYVQWNATGTQLIYSTTIPASSITGLAAVATSGDYDDLINKPGLQTITLTGDATGSGTGLLPMTLNTVNLTPGTYGTDHFVPTITVNEKGLVTSITTQHVDTTVRDLVPEAETIVVAPRHQYIVTSQLEVEGYIVNHGVIAIL